MDIPRITSREVSERLAAGDVVAFLDARSAAAHAEATAQLPRSIRVPPDAVHAHASALPHDVILVAYCSSTSEQSSARVAAELRRIGFRRAFVLAGGLEAWQSAGYPLEPLRHGDPAVNTALHQPM
jgi:rhodanese-related sulfurtransferase